MLDFMFVDGVFAASQEKAGKVRLLATTNARIESAPDVPTMREAGVGNYSFMVWWMIMTPAGTPADVVNKLNAIFTKIADMPGDEDLLEHGGVLPLKGTPAEMVVKLEKDIETWAEVAKGGGIVPQ